MTAGRTPRKVRRPRTEVAGAPTRSTASKTNETATKTVDHRPVDRKGGNLRGPEAAEVAGVSYTTWRRMDKEEQCPRSIELRGCRSRKTGSWMTTCRVWFLPELDAWTYTCREEGRLVVRDEWEPIWKRIQKEWIHSRGDS